MALTLRIVGSLGESLANRKLDPADYFRVARDTGVLGWLHMVTRAILASCGLLWLLWSHRSDQSSRGEAHNRNVRALHLAFAAGPVPVYYSAGFEARALRYQKAITHFCCLVRHHPRGAFEHEDTDE